MDGVGERHPDEVKEERRFFHLFVRGSRGAISRHISVTSLE